MIVWTPVDSVDERRVQVVQRVVAIPHVQRVAVGEERLAAARLDVIAQHLGVLMAQKRHVAHLAEMDFDGDELILEIDLIDAGLLDEPLEFGEDAVPRLGMHVREAHL